MRLIVFCSAPGLFLAGASHPMMAEHPLDVFSEAQLFELARDPHIALAVGHTVFPRRQDVRHGIDAATVAQLFANALNGAGQAGAAVDPVSAQRDFNAAYTGAAAMGVHTNGGPLPITPVPGLGLPDILPVAGDTANAAAERDAELLAAEVAHVEATHAGETGAAASGAPIKAAKGTRAR